MIINMRAGATGTAEWIFQTRTYTPTGTTTLVEPGNGYDGIEQLTVNGSTALLASNIKKGVTIFGVTGTFTGS